MSRVIVLGATGSLGRYVALHALRAAHEVSLVVRSPARVAPVLAARGQVITADLRTDARETLARRIEGHTVLVCCAGNVIEGAGFVALVDNVVSAVELLPGSNRPVCWFLAGAALLDLDGRGRRGVDLPRVRRTYWPHRVNFERLQETDLDWRLLCPGPMVDQPGLGYDRLRVSVERLPVDMPAWTGALPALGLLGLFASRIPEMIVPYPDAADVILTNISPGGPMSRRRVGLALPAGMKGRKSQWTAASPGGR